MEKKKDLIPIAAIVVFLIIIVILCAARLNERKQEKDSTGETAESAYTVSESQTETQTETETETETESAGANLSAAVSAQDETESVENELPSGKQKEQTETKPAQGTVRTISGNDPFAAAEGVNKTNEEMLVEMASYWEQNNTEALDDLAHLSWFMKMSASIADSDTFYYYGERNSQGQPDGLGIACYADNAYYYGQWSDGMRQGDGEWIKYYIYYDDDTVSDRAYQLHMYRGEWASDMPNGVGQEHYDLDLSQADRKDRYIQNVIGTFKDGLYSGEMYLTTLNWDGNQEEWNGIADEGVWSPYGSATNKREVPVCRNVDDESNYLWLSTRNNKERGIGELMP